MFQFKVLIICVIFFSVLNLSCTVANGKNSKTAKKDDQKSKGGGPINLAAGDKPCFCPKKWGGIQFPMNLCGKEILKLDTNSDCKPEYAYQCFVLGERATAVALCPNTEDAKLCGPLRPNSFNFEPQKEVQHRIRECSSERDLKSWIIETHNGEFTSWKNMGA